jgi:UDP-N-acetylglucosamine--N-acetylmuramyl-(pentapeptide) pyrophosphoryl-undecaprenol N-acetylglucosamine transferase
MRVVIAGGGTAGHIEPALALADALRADDPDTRITALGTERGLETRLVPERGYPLELIPAVPLPRRITPALFAVPGRLVRAVRATAQVLDRCEADVVVGFGGYVALPAYLAARRRKIAIVVHEANARPGLANRIGARLTSHVAVATAVIALPHATTVGIPVRNEISELDRMHLRAEARAHFTLQPDKPTLLVFGGSQGARRLNDAVVGAARTLLDAGAQILHATGPANLEAVRAATAEIGPGYVAVDYIERMALAYSAADLAVTRAGALTCAEVSAVGLPACFVPLPHGNGEQRLNARPIVTAGGGVLIDDAALTAAHLAEVVVPLLGDGQRLAAMGAAAAGVGHRGAADALAALVRAAVTRR